MKIALNCNTAYGKGGQGAFLAHAAQGFHQLGQLNVFCTASAVDNELFQVHPLGGSNLSKWLLSIPYIRRRKDWGTLISDIAFDQKVSHQLQHLQPDLIVGVAGQSHLSFRTAKSLGARCWLYCLNCYLPFMKEQVDQEHKFLKDTSKVMHPRMLYRFQQECRLAELILLNSQVAKQTFIDAGFEPERLVVLTPPVNTERFHPVKKPDSVFRVLYVGTIEPRKGVHYLIDAFEAAQIPNSELLLVGSVSSRAMKLLIQEKLSKNPRIKQEQWDFNQSDPTEVFGRCSILVLPSVEDGFGLVALEAMACGLPVIVTSHCGAADVVAEGVNGFVISPRDRTALANLFTKLTSHPDLLTQMKTANEQGIHKYSQQMYSQTLAFKLAHHLGNNIHAFD
jgi:glycosyltransferase involved in cell wall biosynthesis